MAKERKPKFMHALSLAAASAAISVHPRYIIAAVSGGELAAYRIGKKYLIRLPDLDDWLRRQPRAPFNVEPSPED